MLSPSTRAAFLRFACVGLTMALIDIGLLYLLKDRPAFNAYTARLVSYPAGLTVGYFLNRYFTFHHIDNVRHVLDELARFFAVHAVGGLLNFGVFSLVVYAGEGAAIPSSWAVAIPLVGVCLGGVVGMCFNFFVSRELVFDG
ncbi:MAG: GtrA family protein [Pseudohaliea sp.]